MLQVINIVKKYKDKIAVNDVNVELDNGIYGLLGANGAGKTTLINIIAGVKNTSSGVILWDGIDISELGQEYRQLLGFLPQKIALYPNLSVKDYLDYMCVLKNYNEKEWREKEIIRVLELVNLIDVKNSRIKTLSGGMHQRLAIAQSLIGSPKILLYDEPTVGLDPEERIRFKSILNNLKKDAIIVVSTHILSDLSELADVLCMFKKGKLIYKGNREDWEQENIDKMYMEIMEGTGEI